MGVGEWVCLHEFSGIFLDPQPSPWGHSVSGFCLLTATLPVTPNVPHKWDNCASWVGRNANRLHVKEHGWERWHSLMSRTLPHISGGESHNSFQLKRELVLGSLGEISWWKQALVYFHQTNELLEPKGDILFLFSGILVAGPGGGWMISFPARMCSLRLTQFPLECDRCSSSVRVPMLSGTLYLIKETLKLKILGSSNSLGS